MTEAEPIEAPTHRKHYLYCESTEGGMSEFHVTGELTELGQLRGWRDDSCLEADEELEAWAQRAQIGDWTQHRLGIMVRLKDFFA